MAKAASICPQIYRQMLGGGLTAGLLEVWLGASIVSASCNLAPGRGLGVEATFHGNSGEPAV